MTAPKPTDAAEKATQKLYRDLAWDTDEPEGMNEVALALDAFAAEAVAAEREAIAEMAKRYNPWKADGKHYSMDDLVKAIRARGAK